MFLRVVKRSIEDGSGQAAEQAALKVDGRRNHRLVRAQLFHLPVLGRELAELFATVDRKQEDRWKIIEENRM